MVIDCTGEDYTATAMNRFEWRGAKLFVSVSLGLYARRLFCFIARGATFPHKEFLVQINPWLRKETQDFNIEDLPRDGPGCWSFRHPARVDDVWMMTAAALKIVEQSMVSPPEVPTLVVIEQQEDGTGNFVGVRIAAEDGMSGPTSVPVG